jgi:hypothetical protein
MKSRKDWEIEQERRKILQDQMITDFKKDKFIDEIKNGLGKCILEEPNKKQKKLGFFSKIKNIFRWN